MFCIENTVKCHFLVHICYINQQKFWTFLKRFEIFKDFINLLRCFSKHISSFFDGKIRASYLSSTSDVDKSLTTGDPRSFPKRPLLSSARFACDIHAKFFSYSNRPLLSCARFTCDIYAKFVLLLWHNEEVEKLRCKLSGLHVWPIYYGHEPFYRRIAVSGIHCNIKA